MLRFKKNSINSQKNGLDGLLHVISMGELTKNSMILYTLDYGKVYARIEFD